MPVSSPVQLDRRRIDELTSRELAALNARTTASEAMYARARQSLSGGVASSYQERDPWPIYLVDGEGPRVRDVDANQYWDFHNGFGSMVQGHAHPAIVEAVRARVALGTHFAAVTEDTIVVAEDLKARFGLPRWRFVNSGSEATMDAIRIARGLTGRDTIVKIFGSYHGHHDAVMVSIGVPYDNIGDRENLASLPYGAGIPADVVALTIPVPFNDAPAMERRIARLEKEGRKPACVIMEAAMMNLGVVLPEPGYLEEVREITARHGIVLIFDEVKTGLAVAAGGATERFGVTPDMVTLAKTLGGGLPSGAIGGTEEVMRVVEDVIERHRLPGYAVGVGSKGCVTFSPTPIVDYETFKANQDVPVTELAWLWNMNRGIFMTPGREEEWTLSVTHTDEAIDDYVQAFDAMAAALTA